MLQAIRLAPVALLLATLIFACGPNAETAKPRMPIAPSYTATPPAGLPVEGKIIAGVEWMEDSVKYYAWVAETEIAYAPPPGADAAEAEDMEWSQKSIFAHVYAFGKEQPIELWTHNDEVKECPFDLTLAYIDGTLKVTDLDNDGTAEVAFMYQLSCKSDVSPDEIRLLMYEGKDRYSISGIMGLKLGTEINEPPVTTPDAALGAAPEAFRKHAEAIWNAHNQTVY